VLSVRPSTGVVAAHSRLDLTATFAPAAEAPLAGRISCAVRRMSRPLALTAKGSGYLLRDSMQVHNTIVANICAHQLPATWLIEWLAPNLQCVLRADQGNKCIS